MVEWLKELDEALRGHKGDPQLLAEGTGHIRILPLAAASIALGIVYGVFMGLYAVTTRTPPSFAQPIASAVKVPALFFLTLVVTFPSLYVFSALLGVRLGPADTFRLILVPIAVNLAVLASLGPITAFFTLSTTSYAFMKLLNVFFFAVAGFIGLKVLLKMLSGMEEAPLAAAPPRSDPVQADPPAAEPGQAPPAPVPPPHGRRERATAGTTFMVWIFIYALVGAQMGWILRPFIGAPDLPFTFFRERQANFFIDVLRTLGELLRQ